VCFGESRMKLLVCGFRFLMISYYCFGLVRILNINIDEDILGIDRYCG